MIDNIVGAIARSVIADISTAPVEEIVNVVLANLPLKDDTDEYDIIFKFFTTLFSAQHASFSKCLPKIVECSAVFYTDPATDKVCHFIFMFKPFSLAYFRKRPGLSWLQF